MRTGISLTVSPFDRRRLMALVKDRNSPQKHVWRAEIVLLTADGAGTIEIMRRTGKSKTCVWRWQERFAAGRRRRAAARQDAALAHSAARARGGRARGGADARRPAGRDDALDRRHDGARRPASAPARCSASGRRTGCSRTAGGSSSSPTIRKFVDKLRDVVGLYVDPPAHAIVLSVDEKSQIQALDRTQPGLPMKKGRLGTMTHDYKRHGTTTLFAALNVLDGTVIGRNMQRHRHQEFIRFLNAIDAEVPAGKAVHVILDNYAAHKHPKVRAWLDRHPRFTFHFTPTSCSWLNAVEGFFAKLVEASPQARRLPLRRRPPGRHQPLPRRAQPATQTLHLDRRSRQNHRRRQTWAPSVRFHPLASPLTRIRARASSHPPRPRRTMLAARAAARRRRPAAGAGRAHAEKNHQPTRTAPAEMSLEDWQARYGGRGSAIVNGRGGNGKLIEHET